MGKCTRCISIVTIAIMYSVNCLEMLEKVMIMGIKVICKSSKELERRVKEKSCSWFIVDDEFMKRI